MANTWPHSPVDLCWLCVVMMSTSMAAPRCTSSTCPEARSDYALIQKVSHLSTSQIRSTDSKKGEARRKHLNSTQELNLSSGAIHVVPSSALNADSSANGSASATEVGHRFNQSVTKNAATVLSNSVFPVSPKAAAEEKTLLESELHTLDHMNDSVVPMAGSHARPTHIVNSSFDAGVAVNDARETSPSHITGMTPVTADLLQSSRPHFKSSGVVGSIKDTWHKLSPAWKLAVKIFAVCLYMVIGVWSASIVSEVWRKDGETDWSGEPDWRVVMVLNVVLWPILLTITVCIRVASDVQAAVK